MTTLTEPIDTDEADAPAVEDAQPPRSLARPWFGRLVGLAGAVAAGLIVAFVLGPKLLGAATPHLYAGTVLQQSAPAPSLEALELADGSAVELTAYKGDVVLVFFGYAGCPDVCPTTLSIASQAIDRLEADAAGRVRLIMVSVDPERDDPQTVHDYASFFHPAFLGAGGSADEVLSAATRYGIFYDAGDPADPNDPDEYFVDHTATLMAVDPGGTLRVVWAPDVTIEELRGDLAELLAS